MSLPLPLSVRLRTSLRDVHVTDQVGGLSYATESPGGFGACTVTLHRPITFTPGEVGQFGRMYVYDAATGETVWEGRLQDPGRTAGDSGQVYELAGVGGSAHLQDTTAPYMLLDRSVARWEKRDDSSSEVRTGTVQVGEEIGGTQRDTVYATFPSGTKLVLDNTVTAIYRDIAEAGMELALVDYIWDSGITSPNSFIVELVLGNGVQYRSATPTTSGETYSTRVVDTNWPVGQTTPMLRLRWNSATPVTLAADIYWVAFVAPIVLAVLYDRDGTKITTGYTSADITIKASTVIKDLLGRFLTDTIDGANALVTATTYEIEQLAYPDGVTPAQVLEDLIGFEPAYTWHVWQSALTTDLFTFEWLPWPTTVRYEADVRDGFTAAGSAASLYNQVRVRYRDARGRIRSVLRTRAVQALTDAGFDRTGFLDLGDEVSSFNNAVQAGDQWLAERAVPVNAGRLTVARPILDLQAGRMVQPWELRAGSLIRVRGVAPYPDSLNVTTRDGVTVFRVAATQFDSSTASTSLELDSYAPSVARALAKLAARRPTRRR